MTFDKAKIRYQVYITLDNEPHGLRTFHTYEEAQNYTDKLNCVSPKKIKEKPKKEKLRT